MHASDRATSGDIKTLISTKDSTHRYWLHLVATQPARLHTSVQPEKQGFSVALNMGVEDFQRPPAARVIWKTQSCEKLHILIGIALWMLTTIH